ncbi:hypothetical protein [Xenorhabdus bovienii]|uniref:hypothetical protein n=1 Tax=Xenorhabdus bovienii TaxID=40576 RepID=UPI00237CADBA|nr:hypothetical protein [Xenorhabdus bovienii]MDE1482967.1 hypothetical protein [Xenorhabdus bovienii]MDE9433724.1 hypothetical protein [Xenorhabdus bovienii]MDE9443081.1 hypothetical protein [Xenorhabdus bovienii]MDE9491350.1 hypothetical protein [Xenorhabdus bovienii]MDE9507701.1 hypothetical protein [Xenorhabdus bovienii]
MLGKQLWESDIIKRQQPCFWHIFSLGITKEPELPEIRSIDAVLDNSMSLGDLLHVSLMRNLVCLDVRRLQYSLLGFFELLAF